MLLFLLALLGTNSAEFSANSIMPIPAEGLTAFIDEDLGTPGCHHDLCGLPIWPPGVGYVLRTVKHVCSGDADINPHPSATLINGPGGDYVDDRHHLLWFLACS
jgi:hypothetical protein